VPATVAADGASVIIPLRWLKVATTPLKGESEGVLDESEGVPDDHAPRNPDIVILGNRL